MRFEKFIYNDKKITTFAVERQINLKNNKKTVTCRILCYNDNLKHIDKNTLNNIINYLAWELALDDDSASLFFQFEASFSAMNEVSSEYLKIDLGHKDWLCSASATIRFSDHNCMNNSYNFNWSFDKEHGEALNAKKLEILIEDMKEESDS